MIATRSLSTHANAGKCIHKLHLLTQSDSACLQVSPVIFNFWFAAGIVISSLVLLVKYPLVSLATRHPLPCVLHDRILISDLSLLVFQATFTPLTAACSVNGHMRLLCYFQTTSACLIRQHEPKPVMQQHQRLCVSGTSQLKQLQLQTSSAFICCLECN